jgi:putative ABC transport system permease protein
MMGFRELLHRLGDRVRRERLTRELDDELRFHRSMLERDAQQTHTTQTAHGVPAADEARVRLGNTTYYREETRDMWSLGAVDDLAQDLNYALRAVRAAPAFTLVVTLTLALGIGATTAIYTVVDSVLLRPLPYAAPNTLMQLIDVQTDGNNAPASYREYVDWRQRSTDVFSEVAANFGTGEVLQTTDGATQLQGARVSANLPALLGIRPLLGRTFRADEDLPGGALVVMLSEPLWRARFAADPSIVGRTVMLSGQSYVVIGVFADGPNTLMPSVWDWSHRRLPDFMRPLLLTDKNSPAGMHWLNVIGRLRTGVDVLRARTRLAAMSAAIQHDRSTKHGIAIKPLADGLFGNYRAPLRLLLAAAVVLLLVACVNTANLLMARGATRRREFAVRTALGSGRARLWRLLLVESTLRALLGGAFGVAAAYALVRGMRVWLGGSIARVADATIDGRVLAIAVIITVGCGVVFGLLPALRAGRTDVVNDLRDGGRGAIGGVSHDRIRRALMVSEVALSFVLLATAGLLTRSVVNLLHVPTGFDTNNLIAGFTWLPQTRYPDSLAQLRFFDRLTTELGSVYGPANVTLASDIPIVGGTDGGVGVEGRTYPDGGLPNAEKRIVGANYLDVLGARIVAGRSFLSTDVLGAPPVIVINQTLARQLFPNENPIGKRVSFGWGIDGFQTVVGVVADMREGALDQPSRPAIYISCEQRPAYAMRFLVRTTAPEAAVTNTFRAVLRQIDPTIPLVETQTMASVIRKNTEQQRLTTIVLGAFAGVALVLAAIGLYGVISYSVAQRTQELGVRAALGALPRDLIRLVLGQVVAFAATGIMLGLLGAMMTRRVIAGQLFGVGPSDPVTLIASALVLLGVAAAASVVPMRRAAQSDPLAALRAG